MTTTHKRKKNLIVSYKNMTDELKELFKEAYPEGHTDYITKFVKPNGEAIYVVPFETEDTAYMVKFDMKVDTLGEDLDKVLFDDDGDSDGKEDEFAPLSEAIDKEEENVSHNERHLRHGDFEDILSNDDKKKKSILDVDKDGLKDAFDEMEEMDDKEDAYDGEDDLDDEVDFEPSDDDLIGIEAELENVESSTIDVSATDNPQEDNTQVVKSKASSKKNGSSKTTIKAPHSPSKSTKTVPVPPSGKSIAGKGNAAKKTEVSPTTPKIKPTTSKTSSSTSKKADKTMPTASKVAPAKKSSAKSATASDTKATTETAASSKPAPKATPAVKKTATTSKATPTHKSAQSTTASKKTSSAKTVQTEAKASTAKTASSKKKTK